jgi:C4-dicarboxylate-specific signal transduction histidine kinase
MTYDVLFVDDEPENLTVFEAACTGRFNVLIASSAAQALELLRQHVVYVLLADQRMPKMTGLELLERVQREYPEVVRMLVTAYADLETAIGAINRGQVRRYLKKPWQAAELMGALADGVEYYQMRAKLCGLERRLLETERVYSLGVITAGLARELDGPVSAVRGHVTRARTLLRETLAGLAPDSGNAPQRGLLLDMDEELGETLVAAQRAIDIVRGVAIPTGPAKRQDVDVCEVLRLTMRLLQSELRTAGSVEIDVHPVPTVSGSAAQVGQVMLNLLVSALDMMAGSPRHQRAVSIRLRYDEPWVVFEVKSSGPPCGGELDSDFRLGARTDAQRGLGLAISRSIVQDLGGELDTDLKTTGFAVRRVRFPHVNLPPAS